MTTDTPQDQTEHNRRTREAYDRLAPVWSATTGIEVSQQFWRRPLSATLGAFADAGFAVDRVAEPQPSQAALQLFHGELAGLVGVPVFIVYRLWLRP